VVGAYAGRFNFPLPTTIKKNSQVDVNKNSRRKKIQQDNT
jgi:hypothetical protein